MTQDRAAEDQLGERLGSPFGGETFYFPAEAAYSIEELHASRQTTISLTLPSTIQSGGRWNARLICHSANASPLDTLFEYTSVGLSLEALLTGGVTDPVAASSAPLVRADGAVGGLPRVSVRKRGRAAPMPSLVMGSASR